MPTAIDEYPLSDLLYRTAALTDDTGQVVEAYDTDAYGNTLAYDDPGPDGQWFTDDDVQTDQPTCQYIFTGRQFDPESQIYLYRARYYQPALGRFVSRDPMNYRGGINLYNYVANKPSISFDPFGQCNINLNKSGRYNPVPSYGKTYGAESWIASLMPESMYDFYLNLMHQRSAHPARSDTLELGGLFLNEIIALPDIQADMSTVRAIVKADVKANITKMCNRGCTLTDHGEFPIAAPASSPNIRLSLQRFNIFWDAHCSATCWCDVATHSLHARYSCDISWSLFDIFRFRSWEPYGWIGTPFNVYGAWDDTIYGRIKVGP